MTNALSEPKLDLKLDRPEVLINSADFHAAIIKLVVDARKAEAHAIVLRSR